MRRVVALTTLFLLVLASNASAAQWHSEQPVAGSIGVAAPLGPVGDIECWQANRCLLITAGNDAMPAGLYSYDGIGWHLYSTVCGGRSGRIAWAGPDDFWTISDQKAGEATVFGPGLDSSLCHFEGGRVVASYAEPLGQPGAYLPMNAASCSGPDDCWFAGERLPGTMNTGAFHLHWNGQALTAVPSLSESQALADPARSVESLVHHDGRFYESVRVQEDDEVPAEQPTAPSLIHRLPTPASDIFESLGAAAPLDLGAACMQPWRLEALHLFEGGDGSLLGIAGDSRTPLSGKQEAECPVPGATVTATRLGTGDQLVQLPLSGTGFQAGDSVEGVAEEPGNGYAWVSFRHLADGRSTPARMARVHDDGTVDGEVTLPAEGEGIARKGAAGPVACPAAGQCWMATERGWLFHFGGPLPQDTDSAMHQLITDRPCDDACPAVPPIALPEDDSGAEVPLSEGALQPKQSRHRRHRPRALVIAIRQKMVRKTVLQLSFTLRARARVRLLAKRHRKVVARTRLFLMEKGPHHLRLRLDPRRWPTGLALEAKALHQGLARAVELGAPEAVAATPPPPAATPKGSSAQAAGIGPESGGPVAQLVVGAPPATLFGASPGEAPGEVWGQEGSAIVRYTDAGDWQQMSKPIDGEGGQVSKLTFASGAAAGRTTVAGGVAALAIAEGLPALVVRDPGGPLRLAPDPGGLLLPGEKLFAPGPGPLVAPSDEAGGHTGAFVVPVAEGLDEAKTPRVQTGVLYFDGTAWSREDICLGEGPSGCNQRPTDGSGFKVLAIDGTGPAGAWLLAGKEVVKGATTEIVEMKLFEREGGSWRLRPLAGAFGPLLSKSEPAPGLRLTARTTIAGKSLGQPLTVTPGGLWIDASLAIGSGASAEKTDATFFVDTGKGEEANTAWCDAPVCTYSLGSELPAGEGRSFAWTGGNSEGFGQRTITGIGQGAMLVLEGHRFRRIATVGGETGAASGAALNGPEEGWLGSPAGPVHLTLSPERSPLLSWPVPFRRPLLAVVSKPGSPVGALGSEALGVGDDGQVARYLPGQGWRAEPLLDSSGTRATPRLRGVAWPEPGRAFAVGDGGAMWLWRSETGLWEPDPAKPPNLIRDNFTAIAFDPSNPTRGYAVGQQGLLLGYGRRWTQEPLPAEFDPEANFTSIAFAGGEALATYKVAFEDSGSNARYAGGLLVNDGSGWRIDEGVASALGSGEYPQEVAALPDGGAIVASGSGKVIERNGPGSPWNAVAGKRLGFPAALAAIREGGALRAVISAEGDDRDMSSDLDQAINRPPSDQPRLIDDPYPLPIGGVLWRQTGSGWRAEEQPLYPPFVSAKGQGESYDLPLRLDPVLALLLSPDGREGWALGGETGGAARTPTEEKGVQTAAVMRYSADAGAPGAGGAPIVPPSGTVSFAVGGNAQCAGPCADLAGTGIGPDVWLPAAVGRAAGIEGMRAFLYTGPGVAEGPGEGENPAKRLGMTLSRNAFAAEEQAYAARLTSKAGSLPVLAAPSTTDLDRAGSLGTFAGAFTGDAPVEAGELSRGYYSFESSGAGGTVRVIVLNYTAPTLEKSSKGQACWLAQQLSTAWRAKTPAIVVGSRDLNPAAGSSNVAADSSTVVPTLVSGTYPAGCAQVGLAAGASAYFFDYPEQNRTYRLAAGGSSIPAFGSGTLGQVAVPGPFERDFAGASGFLLTSVDVAKRNPITNVAPVTAQLVPSIEDLALDAADGTLLQRSHQALFSGLARRPRAGMRCISQFGNCSGINVAVLASDPYVPIPSECHGTKCATTIFPEYEFTSSNPDIADFVKVDPASLNPRSVLLGTNDKPIPDPRSGLLCAFNAGTTTVTIEAGGLAYSQKVTVQPGSVQRPCGTVPLKNPPTRQPQLATPPPPAPAPTPTFANTPTSLPPPPPPAAQPVPAAHPTATPPAPQPIVPYFPPAPALTPVVAIVPPPPPPAAQTTPPSGTSPVTQPVTAPEPEEDEEAAIEHVHHMSSIHGFAVGEQAASRTVLPRPLIPALVLLGAIGLAAGAGGRKRGGHELARATTQTRRGK